MVPLCFAQLQSTEPRKFVISSHSTQPLSVRPYVSTFVSTTYDLMYSCKLDHARCELTEACTITLRTSLSTHQLTLVTTPCQVESTPMSSELLATAMIQLCLRGDRRPILSHPSMGDMLVLYLREEEVRRKSVSKSASQSVSK